MLKRLLILTFAAAATLGAIACGGAAQRPQATRTPEASSAATVAPTATAVVFPTAPAARDGPVWDFVRAWQGAYISPILRPAYLPPGFDTVSVLQSQTKSDPHVLAVEYAGPNETLRIEAGGINPSEAYQDGPQHPVTVRGHDAVLEVNRDGDPRDGVVVWWTEPGTWTPGGGTAPEDHIEYALLVKGLTEEQVLQVADALVAVGP